MAAQEPGRFTKADPARQPQQSDRGHRTGQAHVDRQLDAAIAHAPDPFADHRGSKQIWLTMYVAYGAFSNIAWIVVSSLMKAWLSGYPVIPI